MKTLVIGAAIIDIIMKIKRLPKSGEDILCSETVSAVGDVPTTWPVRCGALTRTTTFSCLWEGACTGI